MGIKKIGIVGSGTMGCQIAELFLKHDFNVTLFSRSEDGIRNCINRFKRKELAEKLETTTSFEDLGGKDIIIECAKEDIKIKREIFERLDKIADKNTIIASNTSSIPLEAIAKNCKNKQNILGLHFFNPVLHMKLVEVVKPDFTSDEIYDSAMLLMKKLDKEPIGVKDTPGFLLNRMLFVMLNEAANLLYEGIATREVIDKVMVIGASHPMGPLKIIDLVGVDVTAEILKNLQKEFSDKFAPSPILLQMLKENKLGRKTKKGFYDY